MRKENSEYVSMRMDSKNLLTNNLYGHDNNVLI